MTSFFSQAKDLVVEIKKKHLKIQLKGHPPIIDGEIFNEVKVEECAWILEDKKTILVRSFGYKRHRLNWLFDYYY